MQTINARNERFSSVVKRDV